MREQCKFLVLGVVCTGITGAEPSPAVCSGCSIALQGECPDVGVMLEFLLGEVQPEHHAQPGWPVASSLPATSTCHPEGFKSSRGRGCGAGEAMFPLLCVASRALPRRCLPVFARLPVPASYRPAQAARSEGTAAWPRSRCPSLYKHHPHFLLFSCAVLAAVARSGDSVVNNVKKKKKRNYRLFIVKTITKETIFSFYMPERYK